MITSQKINKSVGETVRVLCNTCDNSPAHTVLASVDIGSSGGDEEYTVYGLMVHQLVQCCGCQEITYKTTSSNSEDDDYDRHGNHYQIETETLYPPRMAGRKGLADDYAVPREIMAMYVESHQALISGFPILTGIGLRGLLDAVCKERNASGRNLLKKIDDLVEQRVLTPQGAAVLHHIRALGNDSAHEAKPHSVKQLSLAMEVVEHLLKDVYILRAKTDLLFNDKAQKVDLLAPAADPPF